MSLQLGKLIFNSHILAHQCLLILKQISLDRWILLVLEVHEIVCIHYSGKKTGTSY